MQARNGWLPGLPAFAFLLALPTVVQAHPHVWVTIESEVLIDGEGRITGIRHHWTFDEFFSSFAVQGMDANGDGAFDRAELSELAKVNINSLHEFDYFTYARIDGEDSALSDPLEDYFLEHEDGRLTLHFTLPFEDPVAAHEAEVRYAVYDPTFYIDFAYAEGEAPIRIAGQQASECRAELADPPETAETTALSEAFFQGLDADSDFGAQFARDVVIACDAS